MIVESVYKGNDNSIDLLLTEDGAAFRLQYMTRVVLTVGSVVIDSQTNPTFFNWTHDPEVVGKLSLFLGESSLPLGEYQIATLRIYGPGYPDGKFWDKFKLNVF